MVNNCGLDDVVIGLLSVVVSALVSLVGAADGSALVGRVPRGLAAALQQVALPRGVAVGPELARGSRVARHPAVPPGPGAHFLKN